eukprot:3125233-Pleurochrysis_carterae.AAC.1
MTSRADADVAQCAAPPGVAEGDEDWRQPESLFDQERRGKGGGGEGVVEVYKADGFGCGGELMA